MECITLLVAMVSLCQHTGVWQLLKPVMLFTILVEVIGWNLSVRNNSSGNAWVFNINLLLNGAFSLWFFIFSDELAAFKRRILVLVFAFLVFGFTNLFFFQGLQRYNSATEIFLDLSCVVISCLFFYRLVINDSNKKIFQSEYFWYANGLLFYSLGAVVLYIFLDELLDYRKATGRNIYGYINYTLNALLYGSFIIAIICRNRNTRLL